ncbi:MAG: sialate O-acetylesterase, partial [Lewinella sp.]
MRTTLFVLSFLLFSLTTLSAQDLQLFESFTNHAVLQRNVDHPVWGWAKPGRTVKVLFGEQKLSVKADKQGRWRVSLPPTGAGGPHRLSVLSGRESILLTDIYFGDVYLLSGQSNMEWQLRQSDADGSRARAIADPMIRELKVKKTYDSKPRQHLDVDENYSENWIVGSADDIGKFSGVGSYFAHYLREDVDVPIGLLHSSWGGSRIEPWMSPEALGMDATMAMAKNKEMMQEAGMPARKRFAV